MSSERAPFPFIVGTGRSGTTLLRAMLEQHPDLAIPPESYFPVTLASRSYRVAGGFDLGAFARDLLGNARFRDWEVDPALVRERLTGVEPIDFAEAVRRAFVLYAEVHGKSRYGDKTPAFVLHLETLAPLFPEARFLHLVRDGRDVALSLREMPWGPRRITDAAEFWRHRVRKGRAFGARNPDRYLELRYEDLLDDPEARLREVCAFFGLEFHQEMLEYASRGGTSIPARERATHASLAMPPTKGLRDWRAALPRERVAAFEAIAGRELSALGYERAFPVPALPTRARAEAGLITNRLVRLGRRLRRVAGRTRRELERG